MLCWPNSKISKRGSGLYGSVDNLPTMLTCTSFSVSNTLALVHPGAGGGDTIAAIVSYAYEFPTKFPTQLRYIAARGSHADKDERYTRQERTSYESSVNTKHACSAFALSSIRKLVPDPLCTVHYAYRFVLS